jgi:hypothetical protein
MATYFVRFLDPANVVWRVREEPSGLGGLRDWERRCLRFESELGVRYLQPVPENWQQLSLRGLLALCAGAETRCATDARGMTSDA